MSLCRSGPRARFRTREVIAGNAAATVTPCRVSAALTTCRLDWQLRERSRVRMDLGRVDPFAEVNGARIGRPPPKSDKASSL